MKNKLTCPICGEPTFIYFGNPRTDRLCAKHGKLANNWEIVQCPDCGKWNNADEICICKAPKIKLNLASLAKIKQNENEIKCIICGNPSNQKHFCPTCYSKYKDRSIDIRIINCQKTEIIDEYGNLTYTCDDGRKVRSRAEALISNWLYKEAIRSVYEKTIYYNEAGENKSLHPDFYLPDYNLYIEYNELTNPNYKKSKEYTQKIYKSLGYKVLIMTEKDLQDIDACLKPILGLH